MIIVWFSSNASPALLSRPQIACFNVAAPGLVKVRPLLDTSLPSDDIGATRQGGCRSRRLPASAMEQGFVSDVQESFWIGGNEACQAEGGLQQSRSAFATPGETGVTRGRSVHTSLTSMSCFSSALCLQSSFKGSNAPLKATRTAPVAARGQGLTLVHFSAQLEPCLKQTHPHTLNTPSQPLFTGYTTPTRTPYPIQSAQVELRSGPA
jgi:hypothetical protein